MKRKSNTAITVLSLFLLVTVFSLPLPAQEPAPAPAPAEEQAPAQEPAPDQEQAQEQAPATFEGEMWSVDTNAKTLVVKQSAGTEMKFSYSEKTEIVGSAEGKGVEGLATMKGTQVKVHYNSEAEQHTAVRIEILPSKQAMQ
ncbi:MAG: hypothetical protein HYX74_09750 [Acidobacteria bacterium]|nr:hypothetical protein [Acidobacteriota bacterium]